jgi:hypothetical protein
MADIVSFKDLIDRETTNNAVTFTDQLADLMVREWYLPEILDALAKSVKRHHDKLEADGQEADYAGMTLHSIRRLAADLRHLADWIDG